MGVRLSRIKDVAHVPFNNVSNLDTKDRLLFQAVTPQQA